MDLYFFLLTELFCVMLVLSYTFFYFLYRDRSIGLWALAGYLMVGEFIVDAGYHHFVGSLMPVLIQIIDWALVFLASYLILAGVYNYVEKKMPRLWCVLYTGSLLLVVYKSFFPIPAHLSVPVYFCNSLGYYWAGGVLLTHRESKGVFKYLTVTALFVWGSVIFLQYNPSYPQSPTWLSPLEYLLCTVVGGFAVTSFLTMYLQKKFSRGKAEDFLLKSLAKEMKSRSAAIRTYTGSLLEGIAFHESLDQSIDLIENEAVQIETKVRNVLVYNKLSNEKVQGKSRVTIEFTELLIPVIEDKRKKRPEINWEIELAPILVTGDPELWGIFIETLLDYQVQHAEKKINVSLLPLSRSKNVTLRVFNDGMQQKAEDHELEMILMSRITELEQTRFWVDYSKKGITFNVGLNT